MTASIRLSRAVAEDKPRQISYNVHQAFLATGIAESTLRRLVRKGEIAARYHGSTILIDAESLARYYADLPSERVVERDCAANGVSA